MNKLQVIEVSESPRSYTEELKPKTYREQTQAHFDKKWLKNARQFDSRRNIKERVRLERTLHILTRQVNLKGSTVVDLGCGLSALTKEIRNLGAKVDAVDISKIALENLKKEQGIKGIHSCVPHTHLDDSAYDLVICTELIAHLSPREHRLFFNELARLVKRDGKVIFSTSVDIYSEDALDNLIKLLQTELEIIDFQLSYHSRFIRLKNFLSIPKQFSKYSKNQELRELQIEEKHTIWAYWFRLNTTKTIGSIWSCIAPLTNLVKKWINQSRLLLLTLEKLSHSEASISHIIVIAKRKKIII